MYEALFQPMKIGELEIKNRTTCRPKTEKGQGDLVWQDYQRQAV